MRKGIIYKATNKLTGKSYIGQTVESLNIRKKVFKEKEIKELRDKKLVQVYESLLNDWYPTNKQKEESCPEGEQWCRIQKKCVPIGSGMKEDIVDEARTLEGNWKGFASRYDRALEALEDALELIRDDKTWFKKVESLANQLDKLGDQMNREMK